MTLGTLRTRLDDRVYPGALILGVAFGLALTRALDAGSKDWPGTAIQVLATLLVALAIERDALPERSRAAPALAATLIAFATVGSVSVATYHASQGTAMSAMGAGLVGGVIVALLGLLFAGFVARVGRSTRAETVPDVVDADGDTSRP